MLVIIGEGRRVTLSKDTVIGQGGEAVIHKDPDYPDANALKIYIDQDKKRERKLESMLGTPLLLPKRVIAPILPVRNSIKNLIGFQMKRLHSRFRTLNMIFKNKYCRDHGFTVKVKTDLFLQIGEDLAKLHYENMVVGDLNDVNLMVDEERHTPVWIDVDSFQFKNFPCMAGTELYLCPDLYNIDLSKKAVFEPKHDWWSFSLLLLRALLNGVHVFKSGTHTQWQSVLDRAMRGITVFDKEIAYPNVGLSPDVLSDDLLDICIQILKRKNRNPFPLDILKEYGELLIKCSSCELWYPAKRPQCPVCAHKTAVDMDMATKISGFEIKDIILTKGRILHYQKDGVSIYCLAQENGGLTLYTKEDGQQPLCMELGIAYTPGALFGVFSGLLVICPDPSENNPKLYIIEAKPQGVKPLKVLTTGILAGGQAVFACSNRFLYRIAARMLLSTERFGSDDFAERPVAQIFDGQTWFTVAEEAGADRELIIGFHREFADLNWFLIRGNAKGTVFTRYDINIPQLEHREALLDFSVRFTSSSILIMRKTRKFGIERIRIEVLSAEDGKIIQSRIANISDEERWDSIHGKGFSNGIVLHPTDHGIIREKLADKSTNEIALTKKYVTSLDSLDRLGEKILVIKDDRIILI